MKIVELILDDNEDLTGIEAISIVENPAIEEDFIALKGEILTLKEVDKEKKILLGALLVPNKPIYRKNGDEEYYIYFSRETVRKASQILPKSDHCLLLLHLPKYLQDIQDHIMQSCLFLYPQQSNSLLVKDL